MNSFKINYCILIAVIFVAGCCTPSKQNDSVSQFRAKHPEKSIFFVYLNPISLDTYYATFGWAKGSESFESNLKEKFGSIPGINEFSDKAIKIKTEWNDLLMQMFKRLENASSNGGVICQYKWDDGITSEIGFLVVKSGEIKIQEPLITDYLMEKPFSNKPQK